MTEVEVRKLHRSLGIILVGLLAIQAVTGLFLALGDMGFGERRGTFMAAMGLVHHDWNPLGSVFRIILALATAAQGISGIVIYRLMRARRR